MIKRIRRRAVLVAAGGVLVVGSAFGAAASASTGAVTIYSTARPGAIPAELYRPLPGQASRRGGAQVPGYAVVREIREIRLPEARSTVRFTDVAALIDPTTVAFRSLSHPATRVLEQNYQFDLVSTAKLMERYLGSTVTVEQVLGDEMVEVTGTLLSAANGLIIRDEQGRVQVVRHFANIRFPELPGGLLTRPTLVWELAAPEAGTQRAQVSYQTGGMTWWADYNLLYSEGADANSCRLDVGAWVSIINRSGAGYRDARLKLIAGDVHRAEQPGRVGAAQPRAMLESKAAVAGFEEKAFFEYHLYTLGRPATLPDNSTKQLELFPAASGVACEKKLVYYGLAPGYRGFFASPMTDRSYGTQTNKKVDVYLGFENKEANGLGVPLPSGRVRVSKTDPADGSQEFIGEDVIDHTPKDEDVLIQLGSAFDVVGERKQLDFHIDTTRRRMEETIEVRLRNHKDAAVEVIVKENLYRWTNWDIIQTSHRYDKADARTIHFPVKVPKDGETVVRYTVRYSW